MEIDSLVLGQRTREDNTNYWNIALEDGSDFHLHFERVRARVQDDRLMISPVKQSKDMRKAFVALERKLYQLLLPKVKVKDEEGLKTMLKMYNLNDDGDVQFYFKIKNIDEFDVRHDIEYDIDLYADSIRVTKSRVEVLWTFHDAEQHTGLVLKDDPEDAIDDSEEEDDHVEVEDPEPDEADIDALRNVVQTSINNEVHKLERSMKAVEKLQKMLTPILDLYKKSSAEFTLENLNHITECIDQFRMVKHRMLSSADNKTV